MIATKTIAKWVRPVQVFMTLTVCLILVVCCQTIVFVMSRDYVQRLVERKQTRSPEVSEADRTLAQISSSRKEFLLDGTVLLVRQTVEQGTGRIKAIQVADANNRELYHGPPDKNPYAYISWSRQSPRDYQADISLGDMVDVYYGLNADFSRMLCIRTVGPDQRHSVTWVYDPDLGAFGGYGSGGRFIGYLGADGLMSRQQDVRPLQKGLRMSRLREADSANPMVLWVAAHTVYLIDFDGMKVTQIFHADDGSILRVDINHFDASSTSPYLPGVTIFINGNPTAIYLPRSQRLVSIKIPPEWSWEFSSVAATRQGLFLRRNTIPDAPSYRDREAYLQWLRQNRDKPTQRITELMQVQDNGDLKLVSSFEWTQPSGVHVSSDSQQLWEKRIGYIVGVVSPLPTKWAPERFRYSYFDSYHYLSTLLQPFVRLDIYAPANLIMTLILAVLIFLHARPRRTGWGRLAFWLVFVLIFNLAGFLTYLALNHTPLIRCPSCGRRQGLARPDCPACHALLPPPQPRSTDLVLPVA